MCCVSRQSIYLQTVRVGCEVQEDGLSEKVAEVESRIRETKSCILTETEVQICLLPTVCSVFIFEKVQGMGSNHSDSVEMRPSPPILVVAFGHDHRSVAVLVPGISPLNLFVASVRGDLMPS
jgi:hypothetical protein